MTAPPAEATPPPPMVASSYLPSLMSSVIDLPFSLLIMTSSCSTSGLTPEAFRRPSTSSFAIITIDVNEGQNFDRTNGTMKQCVETDFASGLTAPYSKRIMIETYKEFRFLREQASSMQPNVSFRSLFFCLIINLIVGYMRAFNL